MDPREARAVRRSVSQIAASAYFLLMAQLGYLDPEDGGSTAFASVLSRINNATLQKPCLLALELMKLGQLHGNSFGANAISDGKDPERFLTRTAALLPARVLHGAAVPSSWLDDTDIQNFVSIAGRVAHTTQLLMEASLSRVLGSCNSGPESMSPGSMCFELFQPGTAAIMSYFLNYTGHNFVQDLTVQFGYCEDPCADLMRAFSFWTEICACVERYPDLDQQDVLDAVQVDMTVATELLDRKRELFNLW